MGPPRQHVVMTDVLQRGDLHEIVRQISCKLDVGLRDIQIKHHVQEYKVIFK